MKKSASGPDRTSNAFGAQSLSAGLSKNIANSGGLANTEATPVGRPTTDMGRVAGMVSRGTARPGQVQAAQMMSQAANQERGVAALEKYYSKNDAPPSPTPLATAAGAMGVAAPAAPAVPAVPSAGGASTAPSPMLGEGINPLVSEAPPTNALAPKKLNKWGALTGAANQMGIQPAPLSLY